MVLTKKHSKSKKKVAWNRKNQLKTGWATLAKAMFYPQNMQERPHPPYLILYIYMAMTCGEFYKINDFLLQKQKTAPRRLSMRAARWRRAGARKGGCHAATPGMRR